MADSWRLFAVLIGGFTLLFASVLGFVATVEHDGHCRLGDVRDSPQGDGIDYYYSELSDGEQQLFEQLRQNRDQAFHSDACVDGIVRYQDQYYVVEWWRTIRWTNPPTLLATGGFVAAAGVVVSVVRREIDSSPW